MAKTKEITLMCDEMKVSPNNARTFQIDIEGFDVECILDHIEDDDLVEYIQRHKEPEEIFSLSELEKWAEKNGYTR